MQVQNSRCRRTWPSITTPLQTNTTPFSHLLLSYRQDLLSVLPAKGEVEVSTVQANHLHLLYGDTFNLSLRAQSGNKRLQPFPQFTSPSTTLLLTTELFASIYFDRSQTGLPSPTLKQLSRWPSFNRSCTSLLPSTTTLSHTTHIHIDKSSGLTSRGRSR
jgi:hypothetical protein